MRFEQRLSERGEARQRRSDRTPVICDPSVMQLLRLPPGTPDDPVMCFDHRIRSRGCPLDHTDREDGATPVGTQITQTIGEVAFALSPQPGDAMRWDSGKQTGIEVHRTQELQSIE